MTIHRAKRGGSTDRDSVSGPTSYPSGGFSVSTKLNRVDEAMVDVDALDRDARVASVASNTTIVVQALNESSGSEVTGGTDLSGEEYSYEASKL